MNKGGGKKEKKKYIHNWCNCLQSMSLFSLDQNVKQNTISGSSTRTCSAVQSVLHVVMLSSLSICVSFRSQFFHFPFLTGSWPVASRCLLISSS